MKKKLALLMAAIMTVVMVPMTAFAASATTDFNAVDNVSVKVDGTFNSRVELSKDESSIDITPIEKYYTASDGYLAREVVEITVTLDNATFEDDMESTYDEVNETGYIWNSDCVGIWQIELVDDYTAIVTLDAGQFNLDGSNTGCVLDIHATAEDAGDIVATFSSNNKVFASDTVTIATAYSTSVAIASAGMITFVEDATKDYDTLKNITIDGLVNGAISAGSEITLKLKGNYKFVIGETVTIRFLNDTSTSVTVTDDDSITFTVPSTLNEKQLASAIISGIVLETTSKTSAGDIARITISSTKASGSGKDFSSVTLEVAKMVEEAVTYSVEDDDLPVIWAGANNDDENTLEVSIEENTGDILNTSRKATFTFPDGIEVKAIEVEGVTTTGTDPFKYQIDENVVTIWNYGEDVESDATDMTITFILNATPSYEGDVDVILGGEFDDIEFTVATVQAPYTVEAKTSEVLIDYRYVPVNEIVITEAEEDILEEDAVITLQVEKMDFEDAGTYEVTEGDIEVDVEIGKNEDDGTAQLTITVEDESTEASTITISGLELYLDRTLPVGGYALENVMPDSTFGTNILWENSTTVKDETIDAYNYTLAASKPSNGLFKYSAVTVNDSYVEVVTAARDQDDSTTSRKIVITIGATTMSVGTETITLDAPAYINSEDYTMLPVRAISEAFGATVTWDDASKTVTVLSGQRIISMTIGSKTMYINGTPVAMNTAAEITNDRTFIPVRDLANSLGISAIDWNEASATVTLN